MLPETGHRIVKRRDPRLHARSNATATYYEMDFDYVRGGAPGWKFLNYETLQRDHKGILAVPPWPNGVTTSPHGGPWRFPDFIEKPRFVFDRKLGRPPRDLENIDGFWVASAGMKATLEAIDPEACEFRECEVFMPSGEPGPARWLCTITRAFLGSVDLDTTQGLIIGTNPNGTVRYSPTGEVRFKSAVVGAAHLFHVVEISARRVYCDQIVKDACKAAGLKGIRFRDALNR